MVKQIHEMTEKEIIEESIGLVCDASALLFETNNDKTHAAAFMCEAVLKYLRAVNNDENVLLALEKSE